MRELIIGLVVMIAITYGIFLIVVNKHKQKLIKNTIKTLNEYGKVILKDKQILFKKNATTYEILFYKISYNYELTINSNTIWEIHTNTKTRLINQTKYLESNMPKIIIIYPMKTKIKRYINENELVFIDHHDVFYNMRLVKIADLESLLDDVNL